VGFVVISICPEALIYTRRDTPYPTMIFSAAPARTAISSPTGSKTTVDDVTGAHTRSG
jgi:hypothetical protein